MHHAHAATAATAGGLDDDRITDVLGLTLPLVLIFAERALGTRHARHAGGLHGVLGGDLVAHQADGFRTRADEHETGVFHPFGEIGVFRQEAVTGMDRFRVGDFSCGDDRGDVQITLGGRRRADTHRLVGQTHIFGFGVGLGMHRHGFDTHLAAGALDAQGDFAPVRN